MPLPLGPNNSTAELLAAIAALERVLDWDTNHPGDWKYRLNNDLQFFRDCLEAVQQRESPNNPSP